jgi:hypothetical protein
LYKRIVFSAPVLLLLACSAPGFASVLYTDGASQGTNAFFIDGPNAGPFSQNISDSFVATNGGNAGSFDAGIWVNTGTTPTTLSWWLGTSAFGSELSSGTAALGAGTNTLVFSNNEFAYDVYSVHVGGLSGALIAGNTYYLTLGNANNSAGDQFVGWDVIEGPSSCTFAVGGNVVGDCGLGGEAFTINSGTATPEPAAAFLLGSGLLAMAGVLRRKSRA